jgi:hypothetical protein
MTNEELATMLTAVSDELDERDMHPKYGRLREIAAALRPKRVYVWVAAAKSSGLYQYWHWNTADNMWRYAAGYLGIGEIFADHQPRASLTLAEMNVTRVRDVPANWNCKR